MIYDTFEKQVKTGDVLAWTHKGWGSWYDFEIQLVRFFTQSEYNHIGVAYVENGSVYVLESVVGGIRKRLLTEELPCFWVPVGIEWSDELDKHALSVLGQRYSKVQAILSLIFKLKPGVDGSWECAEYVQYILRKAGVAIDVRSTPSEVVEWIQEHLGSPVYPVVKATPGN